MNQENRSGEKQDPAAPQLWSPDALYFSQPIFQTVRNQRAHLLIKYSPPDLEVDTRLFRDVLEDAEALFAAPSSAIDPVAEAEGFDSQRWCSWSMKKTSASVRRLSREHLLPR